MKRTFAILVFASFARLASAAASDNRLPTTGNEMLDACGVLVSMADSPASFTALKTLPLTAGRDPSHRSFPAACEVQPQKPHHSRNLPFPCPPGLQ